MHPFVVDQLLSDRRAQALTDAQHSRLVRRRDRRPARRSPGNETGEPVETVVTNHVGP